MSDVSLVLRVVDRVTAETKRILGGLGGALKTAAVNGTKFMASMDARAFSSVAKGFKLATMAMSSFGAKMNELAPDARKFQAVFSKDAMADITRTAEGYNKLTASLDKLWVRIAQKTNFGAAMEAWGQKIDAIAYNPEEMLSRTEKAVMRLRAAQKAFSEFDDDAWMPTVIIDRQRRELGQELTDATKEVAAAKAEYAKASAAAKELAASQEMVAQAARDLGSADAIGGLASIFASLDDLELAVTWAEIANAWEVSGKAAEWQAQQIEKANAALAAQDSRVATVAETLRDLKTLLREMGDLETEFIDDMWAEINAREQKALDDEAAIYAEMGEAWQGLLDKEAADHAEWTEKIRAQQEALARELDMYAGVLTDNVMGFFDAIMTGSDKAGAAFGRMIAGMLADVGRLLMQKQVMGLFSGLLGGAFGGATGDGASGPGSANFAARSAPGAGLAHGGSARAGQPYMVGERGPELFVPNQSGNVITAGRSGGGIGNVTINVSGAKDPRATAREIKQTLLGLMQSDPSFRQVMRQGATA